MGPTWRRALTKSLVCFLHIPMHVSSVGCVALQRYAASAPCWAVPFCAMLCHVVLHCVMPCCAVPRCAMLCHAVLCHAVLCCAAMCRNTVLGSSLCVLTHQAALLHCSLLLDCRQCVMSAERVWEPIHSLLIGKKEWCQAATVVSTCHSCAVLTPYWGLS